MKTKDFYFDLPEELIAQTPIERRDASRLLVLERSSGRVSHRRFYDLPPVSLPGEVGRFSDWQQQMLTLGNAVDEICTVTAQPLPTWPAIDAYPSAAAVNFIRQAVEE